MLGERLADLVGTSSFIQVKHIYPFGVLCCCHWVDALNSFLQIFWTRFPLI